MLRLGLIVLALAPFLVAATLVQPEVAIFQQPAGFNVPGQPAVAEGPETGTLRLTITDTATDAPTFCRVNVIGSDGNYYEPSDNPLSPWSLHRLGNRDGKGPFRYFGWFFYTSGECSVRVPAGLVRVEVWKGFEYRPVMTSTRVAAGANRELNLTLSRTLPAETWGYHGGDTHIHLSRTSDEEDARVLDLMEAEDIRVGYILCMNEPRSYSGTMDRQLWPQTQGFGPNSVRERDGYQIASGQEYRANTFGHICLLMHNRLVLDGENTDPNNWPVFGDVGRETRDLGGYSFHAHGGYGKEIYADFAQRLTDGVELLQFAEYRDISLRGWYKMLNIGYRFPGVGACDYPYCRALGDCRTYVHLDRDSTPLTWAKAAAQGKSFFTTGPLLFLEVEGQRPGAVIDLPRPQELSVTLRCRCEVTPVTNLELIVNGQTVRTLSVPAQVGQGQWLELAETLAITEPSWIAARAFSSDPQGRPDAEAHTNPVYIDVDGQRPFNREDLDWLIDRLDERIAFHAERDFPEREQVLAYFQRSRKELEMIRR